MKEKEGVKKEYRSGCLAILGLILFIVAFLVLSLGIQMFLVTSRVDSKTEAKIETIHYYRNKNGVTYSLTLSYQAQGQNYKVQHHTSSSYYKEGEVISIIYDSDNPEIFEMATSLELTKQMIFYLTAIGIAGILLSLALMILPLYLYKRKYGPVEEESIQEGEDYFEWTWSRPYGHDSYMKTGMPIICIAIFIIVIGVMRMSGMSFANIFVEYGAIVGFFPGMYLAFMIYAYVSHGGNYKITYRIMDNKIRYSKPDIGRVPYRWIDLKKVETVEWDDEAEVIRLSGKKLNEKLMAKKEDYLAIEKKIKEITIN